MKVIRYKKLLTLKILDRDTREPIGKIEEIICSDDFKKVDYLVIKNGNLIKNKAIIRFDDIHFINKDQVVYIKADNDLDDKMERNISSEKEGSKLFNKEIIDENEECIGYNRRNI